MEATLHSNRNDEALVLAFGAREIYAKDAGVLVSVRIRTRHWDGDHTHDLDMHLQGLWLRPADLARIRDRLAAWLRLPLDALDPRTLDSEWHLTRMPGQRLMLAFAAREDVIADRNPVLTVLFAAGGLSGSFHFVIDQSCLETFVHDLAAAIGAVN